MTKILEDKTLPYLGVNGEALECRVRLFQTGASYVLLATDLGCGVTGSIERVTTIMVRRWEIEPSRLRVIEHHDYRNALRSPEEPQETLAFVGFDWDKTSASNPTWRQTTRNEVQALVGAGVTW